MSKDRLAPPAVCLRSDEASWAKLQPSMQWRITKGVERIARLHHGLRLSRAVQVSWLPPVDVHDALWTTPGGVVQGRVSILRRGDREYLGVELPVHVALSEDEEAIRRVLLHEFGHCFFYVMKVIEAMDGKKGEKVHVSDEVGDLLTNEAADRARLANPADWFSAKVAADYPYWNDAVTHRLNAQGWRGMFREDEGTGRTTTDGLSIPDDVATHARRILCRPSSEEASGEQSG